MRKLIAALVVAAPLTAAAQTKKPPRPAPPPATQRFDFDNDVVEVDPPRSSGELILANHRNKLGSMLKMREDFKAEMLATAARL